MNHGKQLGLFTGEPVKAGQSDKRRAYKTAYKKRHPDRIRAEKLRYAERHPGRMKAYRRRYRQANNEQEKATRRDWHRAHRERDNARCQKWNQAHGHQQAHLYDQIKRGAKRRGYRFELSPAQYALLRQQACFYCGALTSLGSGLDRVDNAEGYLWSNVVASCARCNYAKRTQSQAEFFDMCKRVVARHGLQPPENQTGEPSAGGRGALAEAQRILDQEGKPEGGNKDG